MDNAITLTDAEEKKVEVPVAIEVIEEEPLEFEYAEPTSPLEYIQGAYFSLSAIEGIDTEMMSKEDAKRIRRIRRKSIELIDESLSLLHSDFFEDDHEDE